MRKTLSTLCFLALWLVTCNLGSSTVEITGNYILVNIDGNELPYMPAHEGGAPEIISSTLIIDPDGTFRMTMVYGTPTGNSVQRDFNETYTWKDGNLRFAWEGAGITPVTLEGKTLTIINEGIAFAYEK